jgi:hypothetical protein
MGAWEEAMASQERQTAMEEEYPRLWEEIERLKAENASLKADVVLYGGRARRLAIERERDAMVEAWPDISVRQVAGHPMMPDGWYCCGGRFVGSHGPFGSKLAAIRHSIGLDAAPAGAETPP